MFTNSDKPVMYRVRLASLADVGEVTKIVIKAMPSDPQWKYRFPYVEKFPHDHYKYTYMLYEQFARQENDDWRLIVLELLPEHKYAPFSHEELSTSHAVGENPAQTFDHEVGISGIRHGKIVAFSVWNVSYINIRKFGPTYQPQNPVQHVAAHGGASRKDMNPQRQKAFRDSATDTERYFARYGSDRITLQVLGTHPDYWRQGYATALCRYGMRIAAEDGLVMTVVAGQTGLGLYRRLSFTSLGILVKQVPGEEEKVISEAMVFDPHDQATGNL